MNEAELARTLIALPGVAVTVASKENDAPEVAWGDSFFYYDPQDVPEDRRFPFATIVVKDYPGFDTESDLDRDGVFRLNLAVGRDYFTKLFGFPPTEFDEHRSEFDFTALDRVIPHPVYAPQSWVSILVPDTAPVRDLIAHTYERAKSRHRTGRREGTT
jgi:hypothetical protein